MVQLFAGLMGLTMSQETESTEPMEVQGEVSFQCCCVLNSYIIEMCKIEDISVFYLLYI